MELFPNLTFDFSKINTEDTEFMKFLGRTRLNGRNTDEKLCPGVLVIDTCKLSLVVDLDNDVLKAVGKREGERFLIRKMAWLTLPWGHGGGV